MPFGGSPCPSVFGITADLVTDTINDLLNDKNWKNSTLYSEKATEIPPPIPQNKNIPFAQARSLSVELPDEDWGKADVYVDDIISIAVDINDNLDRVIKAPITVIQAVAHRANCTGGIERDPMVEKKKTEIEGPAEELKICLGWIIDTRRLLVSLPHHKYIAWTSQIDNILQNKTVSNTTLMSILGRLENVAQVLIILGHFLSNIRSLQMIAERKNHNIKLNTRSRLDLVLAKDFLTKVNGGVSMNLLTFRKPTNIHICDASEHGLGGFANHGRAWSYVIPLEVRGRAHINILEYLAQVVAVWVDILDGTAIDEDCLLCMGDNTSAMGWLRRSNFRQKDESDQTWLVKQEIGRHLARLVLKSNIMLYTQWLKGSHNQVADSLSRDAYYLNANTHKIFLFKTVSHQLPQNFKIKPLPKEISCWIYSTLQQLPKTTLWLKAQKRSELADSNIGILTSIASELQVCSSTIFHRSIKTSSCQDSHKHSEKAPSLEELKNIWWKVQSKPPCHMWHRPLGQTIGKTPDWTLMAKQVIISKNSAKDMGTKTKGPKSRRHFH